jgi:FAD/FMN-containing dehydrogenase
VLVATSEQSATLLAAGISRETLADLEGGLRGALLRPDSPGYDDARRLWNGMVDKHPAVIVRCAGVSDALRAVRFARDVGAPIAIRGGGHNVAGNALCDGGVVVDLSAMRSVHVDPGMRTARAEPGATWGLFDRETQAFGLASTGGVISTTGIAGLTLGGGVGWLVRKHGLACDNLVSVDVITADGELRTASDEQNQDLFWALRGSGSNLGIVTSLEYRLHPVGPLVVGGMVLHPLDKAAEVVSFYRDFAPVAPEDLTLYCGFLSTPDGMPVVGLVGCYSGSPDDADGVLAPVRGFGTPVADLFAPRPYCEMQSMLDAAFPQGMRYRWRSTFLERLPAEAIEAIASAAAARPSPLSAVMLEHYGDAPARLAEDATAFPHRAPQFNLVISAEWAEPADDDLNEQWLRAALDAVRPYSSGRVYLNALDRGENRIREAYGPNYDRLLMLKRQWDPDNVFRFNTNIDPDHPA